MSISTCRTPEYSVKPENVNLHRKRIDAIMADPDVVIDLTEIYAGPEKLPEDIGKRVRTIQIYSTDYTWPYIKDALHYLLLCGAPLDAIARKFNVTVGTISNWKTRMKAEWSDAVLGLDVRDQIIESIQLQNTIKTQCMQEALSAKKVCDKVAAMKLASKADREINNLLQRTGAFDDAPLSPKTMAKTRSTGADAKKHNVNHIGELLNLFLNREIDPNEETEGLQPVATNTQPASVLDFPSVRERKPPRTHNKLNGY